MTDDKTVSDESQDSSEVETPKDDKDSIIKDLQKQVEALRGKSNELLAETKQAKQRAREESEAKEKARMEKAKRDGDFEQLLKSSESKNKTLAEQLQNLQQRVSSEKIKNESLKIASDLADGSNAELLSEFINKRLRYTEDGIKVLDQNGDLTVSSIDDLKAEFAKSEKFKSLLRGVKSSGGSAQGAGRSATNTNKEIDRKSFDGMDHVQRMSYIKQGGKVVD
jgi:chromosome segregation ATPase